MYLSNGYIHRYLTGLTSLASCGKCTIKWTIISKKTGGNILSSLHIIKTIHFSNFSKSSHTRSLHIVVGKNHTTQLLLCKHLYSNMVELQQRAIFETKHNNHESLNQFVNQQKFYSNIKKISILYKLFIYKHFCN